MIASRPTRLVALALASALALGACGSGDDDDAAEETTTTAEETTTTEAEPVDPTEEVTAAYTSFFENFKGDLTLLEDGDTFEESAIQPMRDRAAQTGQIGVAVKTVTALDDAGCETNGQAAPCAEVKFDLVVNGEAVVPDQTGYAVYQDDTWKVAKSSFCSLAALGGGVPAGC